MDKLHIVLAEDDSILSKVLVEELELAGYKVTLVEDGVKLFEVIDINKPDLILLDILMAKMTGIEVLEKIKMNPATKDIPIIMLTMLSSDNDIKKSTSLGADDYIVKSQHTIADIIKKVNQFFKK